MKWSRHWSACLGASSIALAGTGIAISDRSGKRRKRFLQTQEDVKWKTQEAREVVERFKVIKGIPGLSVAVSKDNKLIWAEGFGLADVENVIPCTANTKMRIASISKPITATLAAKLMEEGKLDLDSSIYDYIPKFPKKTWEGKEVDITTTQLLCHRSGIRHYKESKNTAAIDKKLKGQRLEIARLPEFYSNTHYESVTASLEMFQHDPLDAAPGSKFIYTTHGFTVAAAVIEAANKKPFEEQVLELLQDMGMHQTHLDQNEPIIANRARHYTRKGERSLENVGEVNCSYKWAGGGLLSNVLDLVRFGNVWLSSGSPGSLLTKQTAQYMWSNDLGWMSNSAKPVIQPKGPWNKTGYVCHLGGACGASSVLVINQSQDGNSNCCVAILVNLQDCGGLSTLALEIIDALEIG